MLLVGGVLLVTGVVPLLLASDLGERVWPILLFVIAITVVTELASEADLFRVVAEQAALWGHGRTWLLWIFVVLIAVVSTTFLSLDTTAVLLTPVVVLMARHAGLPPIPFALTTVWLANTASLLLPVSNLTNLLAQHALGGISPPQFALLMWAPALVAIAVPTLVLFIIYRRQLLLRYTAVASEPASDRVLLIASAVVVGSLFPAFLSGVPVWIPASVGALALLGFFAVRRRGVIRFGLVPWQLVLLASGLFLLVDAARSVGLVGFLFELAGKGDDPLSLLQLATSSALGSNVLNNLPTYLAFESIAGSPVRIAALLIGVNAGCLITPWASLATLLWHSRMRSLEVDVSWPRYIALGALVVPLTVGGAVLALAFVR